jgi:hypothetical protein
VLPIPELGRLTAPNITSHTDTGIGRWTDDEIGRAIREGISRDNTALFPVMPYTSLARLSDEDLASVVVYLRTLPPIRNSLPVRRLVFPLDNLINTIPEPIIEPVPPPPMDTPAERGAYLAAIAGCENCHTPTDSRGRPRSDLAFGGGAVFRDPGRDMAAVYSTNISASGVAHYDRALFVQTLRTGEFGGRTLSHIMPFEAFKNMTDSDLADLFAYLETLPPVDHRVSNTDPPSYCGICRQEHGLGELN